MQRFRERGFVIDDFTDFDAENSALEEFLRQLIRKKAENDSLQRRYRGDTKFVRVHKRIREENQRRMNSNKEALVSPYDEGIVDLLLGIKVAIDEKVYDRSDILKKDAYFEQTVMQQITLGLNQFDFPTDREDRLFMQTRIARQYLDQYNATYALV